MIAVIDSGVANLASVMAALHRLNADAVITSDAEVIRKAERVILPGVGAAPTAMTQLQAKNLVETIRSLTQPVLGICLGMQLMFEHSEEGDADCLGVVPGKIKRMESKPDMPVPHMGWNELDLIKPDHALLNGVKAKDFVYYVHSFSAPVAATTLASTNYGINFSAMVAHKNFFGCQFHPERSGTVGSRILQNFLGLPS